MFLEFYTDSPISVNKLFNQTIYFCKGKKAAWRCAKAVFKKRMKMKKAGLRQ